MTSKPPGLALTTQDADSRKQLRLSEKRISEENGKLDIATLHNNAANKVLRHDIGDCSLKTGVQESPGRGRGLYATEEIAAGELITAEKAVGTVLEPENSNFVMVRYHEDIYRQRLGTAVLWQQLVGTHEILRMTASLTGKPADALRSRVRFGAWRNEHLGSS